MTDLESKFREYNYTVYIVVRKNKYMQISDGSIINIGLYSVEPVLCMYEDDYASITSNFSHILEEDRNAFITHDEIKANIIKFKLNSSICAENVCKLYRSEPEERMFKVDSFDESMMNLCSEMIDIRRDKNK